MLISVNAFSYFVNYVNSNIMSILIMF